jgi:hypothetical protein
MNAARWGSMVVALSVVAAAEAETFGAERLRLIPPWTPVTAKAAHSGVEVGVWGRTLKIDGQALPTSMVTAGEEILAAPVRLVGQASGKPITWKQGSSLLFSRDPDAAVVSGWQSGDQLIANTATRVEFDGAMRIDLVVMPQKNVAPKIERLWLEVPLKSTKATLFHYWPGTWGNAKNSGAVPGAGLRLPFKPCVWLGWEAGGLSWFAESDEPWKPHDPKQAIEIVPDGDQVVLRLHLLDAPPPRLPWTCTFGLQATPVKPWRADFHDLCIQHGVALGAPNAVMPGGKETVLDHAVRSGVKTLEIHEGWTPWHNYPVTTYDTELKQLISACHQRGIKLLVYFGYLLSTLAPEWGAMSDEVLVKDTGGNYTGPYFGHPPQVDYMVCLNSRWREHWLEGIKRSLDRYGYDGFYLDGTMEPFGCTNQKHGCGYRAADGTLHPTYPIFAVRRLMYDLAAVIHPRGGLVNVHQSMCCLTPTLGFADSYWDGEQFEGGELSRNTMRQLPLATFRAEFMGRNFGIPAEFLVYEKPPRWTFDDALAFTLLHDVRVRPTGGTGTLEKMAPIWKAMTRFGVSRAQWHPYWEANPMVTVQPDDVKVSFYLAGSPTEGRRALLVVSNLSPEREASAELTLDLRRMGLSEAEATAKDALSGETLPLENGRLVVPLRPMRMRMVGVQ